MKLMSPLDHLIKRNKIIRIFEVSDYIRTLHLFSRSFFLRLTPLFKHALFSNTYTIVLFCSTVALSLFFRSFVFFSISYNYIIKER